MLSAVKSGSRLSGGQVGKGGKMMPQKATADGAADFKLYAVFGMEAPKELISRHDEGATGAGKDASEQQFYCHFNTPLPDHIVLFGTGMWPRGKKDAKVEVMLGTVKKNLGIVSASSKSFCAEPRWTRAEQEKGEELAAAARVAKVVVTISVAAQDAASSSGAGAATKATAGNTAVATASSSKAKGKRASTGGAGAGAGAGAGGSGGSQQRSAKRKSTDGHTGRRSSTGSNAGGGRSASGTGSTSTTTPASSSQSAKKDAGATAVSGVGNKGKGKGKSKSNTAAAAAAAAAAAPSSRWGHSMDMVSPSTMMIFGGQGNNQDLAKGLWAGDVKRSGAEGDGAEVVVWDVEQAMELMKGAHAPMTRTGHSSAFDPDGGCLHIFGGAKKKRFFSDIHTLEIATNTWTSVKPSGGGVAPTCSYHSMNFHRGELFVFGGVYPEPDPTPDTCSNTLHIFSFAQKNWYKPSIVGTMPCARSGHSATLVEDELVIFGGWDMPAVFNDVFVLDMTLLECSKLDGLGGKAPQLRSWHAATVLPIAGKRCVLVHGGFDGEDVMGDAHVLDLDSKKWVDVSTTIAVSARAGHTAVVSGDGLAVHFFGGGDNEGTFFNDVTSIPTATIAAALEN